MGSGGFVAVLVIELHFPEAGSLKGKRHELSSVKALLQRRFAVAVSETDHQDLWQRATLTAALTGGSYSTLSSGLDNVERWLLGRFPDGVRIERLVASVEDLRG
jgi:uncharacterized protein YlxP (DUF503 family)